MFTRVAQGNIPGEAVVTIRSRTPSDPPVVAIDPQFLQKVRIYRFFTRGKYTRETKVSDIQATINVKREQAIMVKKFPPQGV